MNDNNNLKNDNSSSYNIYNPFESLKKDEPVNNQETQKNIDVNSLAEKELNEPIKKMTQEIPIPQQEKKESLMNYVNYESYGNISKNNTQQSTPSIKPKPFKVGPGLILLVVCFIVGITILFKPEILNLESKDDKEKTSVKKDVTIEKTRSLNPPKPNPNFTAKDYNGIYETKDFKAYLYDVDNTVMITIENEKDYYSNYGDVIDGYITLESYNGNSILTLLSDKETLIVTSYLKELDGLSFIKKSKYTKEEYYNKKYGPIDYLDSKYSGKYKMDNVTLWMYQISDSTVIVNIEGILSSQFTVNSDGTLVCQSYDETIEITLDDNSLIIRSTNQNKNYNGTYHFVQKITIDDVINNKL